MYSSVCACVFLFVNVKSSYVSVEIYHSLCSAAFKRFYRCECVSVYSERAWLIFSYDFDDEKVDWMENGLLNARYIYILAIPYQT